MTFYDSPAEMARIRAVLGDERAEDLFRAYAVLKARAAEQERLAAARRLVELGEELTAARAAGFRLASIRPAAPVVNARPTAAPTGSLAVPQKKRPHKRREFTNRQLEIAMAALEHQERESA